MHSASTSAPDTERPVHADTWKRTVTSPAERGIVDGETVWPSIKSRAGGLTLPTSSVPVPEGGQPFAVGGGGGALALTTSPAFEGAVAEPSAVFPVTPPPTVSPPSPLRRRADDVAAPPMFEAP